MKTLALKITATLIGKEKLSYNLQVTPDLVCIGSESHAEVLDKGKIGVLLDTYLHKSIGLKALDLIDITAVHDKSFYTWKSYKMLTAKETEKPVHA
jgi:hypothetical protein